MLNILNSNVFRNIWLVIGLLIVSHCQKTPYVTKNKQADLTFFVASDTHFGITQYDSVAYDNRRIINEMNHLPGTAYPDSIGGSVDTPKGVLIAGDLTDGGTLKQWQQFTKYYGLTGKDGVLKYPLYEGAGNHDGGPNGPVRKGIRMRNKKRKNVTGISKTGLHYSFNWGNIHFVNLNVYPIAKWDSTCDWCKYFHNGQGFANSEKSLQFLQKDLKERVGESGKAVILYFHIGFTEWNKVWWTQKERDAFYKVIKPYKVIGIFRGHIHAIEFHNFHGIPVYGDGSTQKKHGPGEFLVVHIHDNEMTVIERNQRGWCHGNIINF